MAFGNNNILKDINISQNIKKELIEIIKIRLGPKPIKIRCVFKLCCYNFYGIDAIKESMSNGQKKETKEVPLKFRIIASPLYECVTYTINKNEGLKIMNLALMEVQKTILNKGGYFYFLTNPFFMEENSINIGDLMRKTNENASNEIGNNFNI